MSVVDVVGVLSLRTGPVPGASGRSVSFDSVEGIV